MSKRRHKGLTHAMIEALRRIRRGDDLNDVKAPMSITLAALGERGLINFDIYVVGNRLHRVATLTTAGLEKLLQTADVELESWRGV